MKRLAIIASNLVLCAFLLGHFPQRAIAAEPMRMVVAMPGPHAAPYLPLELMPRIGADRKAGFVLSVRYFGGGPLAVKDMLDHNSDFAGLGMPALAGIRLSNPNLVSVIALTQTPAYVLMARQDLKSQIHKLADLRWRTIGTHSGSKQGKSTARQIAEYLLQRNGIRGDDVNFVYAGQNLADYSAALESGQVDAIVVNEPAATLLEKHKLALRLVDLHDPAEAKAHLGGRFLYTQLATTTETLRDHPDKIRRMNTALRDSLRWIATHSAQDIVARLQLPEGEEKQSLETYLAAHKNIYSPDGAFSEEAARNSEAFFHAVSGDNPAAAQLRYRDFIDSRWSGRSR
ncbi:MAG: ABC transporter substrate-binding protein [Gallionellaceae bacterium]|nr:ABC transporter substrate-binding protein [Gallionellaceae bacterium]